MKDLSTWIAGKDLPGPYLIPLLVLGSLGNDYVSIKFREGFYILLGTDQNPTAFSVAHYPDDFRMPLISYQNALISLSCVMANDHLDMHYPWTSSIYHQKTCSL